MAIGRILHRLRSARAGDRVLRVRPKIFVGYEPESAAKWRQRFGYDRRLPDLAVFCAAFAPTVLAADEAEAETVVKLAYSWGSAAAFGHALTVHGSVSAVSLCCQITVWSRADQAVLACVTFVGAPPPANILSRPRQCRDEILGEMPPLEPMVAFLERLQVE